MGGSSFKSGDFRWLLLITALVIAARAALFFVSVPYTPQVENRDHYSQIARNLINNRGFSESADGSIPTNRRPPLTPFFFAGVMRLLGDNTLAIAFSNWVVDAVTSILLYLIALQIFRQKQIALTGAALYAVYLPEMYYSWQALSEPLFGLLMSAFVASFLWALRTPSTKSWVMAGVFLAAASLTRSAMLYFLPIAVVILVWLLRAQGKKVIQWVVIFSVSFIVVKTPWVIRNYRVFGEFMLADSNLGATLYHNTYALGEPDFLRYRTSEEGSASLRELLRTRFGSAYDGLTQPERDRLAGEEAVKIMRQYPGRYLALTAVNLVEMWYLIEGPRASLSYAVLFLHLLLIVLAVIAFLYCRDEWTQYGMILVVVILFINAGSAAVRANVRYVVPVVPYLMLFASVAIVHILQSVSPHARRDRKLESRTPYV